MELGLCDKVEIHPENNASPNTAADSLVYLHQHGALIYTATYIWRILQVTHTAHSALFALGHQHIDLLIVHYPQAAVYDPFKELLE